jgi:ParB/RepB/Spo0J family partition protein
MPAKKRNVTIPFEAIIADTDFNSRVEYPDIEALKQSIMDDGLLQPIGVSQKNSGSDTEGQKFFLVYGFRRYFAISKIRDELGPDAYATIDAVLNEGNLEELRVRNLKENIERKALTTFEIAQQVKRLVLAGLEQREIATRLGRNQSWVSYHHKVATQLSTQAQHALKAGDITLEQALHIADVPEEQQNALVTQVLNADTRADVRKLLKDAASENGKRRKYTNKGRPTSRNLMQWVSDVSFEAESRVNDKHDKVFYNGVAAGMRVALGDLELKELKAVTKYSDINYHAKDNKAEEEPGLESVDQESDEDVAAATADAAPVKKKRGRPRKIVTVSNSL